MPTAYASTRNHTKYNGPARAPVDVLVYEHAPRVTAHTHELGEMLVQR